MFIPKMWGFEDIAINEAYCGKRMFVKDQHRCSIHSHLKKDELLMVGAEGLLWFEYGDEPDRMTGCWMQENDRIRILPGKWHRFTALRDTMIYEFSTHHEDSDSIRHSNGGKVGDDEYRVLLSSFVKSQSKAKIIETEEAKEIAEFHRKQGRTIGMCNGCFDLMHLGHVELLLQAKMRCQILFVGVNDDSAIKQLKGPTRPYVDEVGRLGMLAANRYPDYIVRVHSTVCLDLVDAIKPSIYITSVESGESCPEARQVAKQGGTVQVVELLPGYNTTKISHTVLARR